MYRHSRSKRKGTFRYPQVSRWLSGFVTNTRRYEAHDRRTSYPLLIPTQHLWRGTKNTLSLQDINYFYRAIWRTVILTLILSLAEWEMKILIIWEWIKVLLNQYNSQVDGRSWSFAMNWKRSTNQFPNEEMVIQIMKAFWALHTQ